MDRICTLLLAVLLGLPLPSMATEYLSREYERAENYEDALKRVAAKPDRYVLVYIGAGLRCPPCVYTQGQLDKASVLAKLKPKVVVVEAFAWGTRVEHEKRLVERFGTNRARGMSVSAAPVLSIVDKSGTEVVRLLGGLKNSYEADLLADYLAGHHYLRMTLTQYVAEKQ